MDIFFVISGLLITGQLSSMLKAGGRIPFGEFYAKRIRRIIPASFAVLALTTVASLLFLPPSTRPGALQDAIATALYVLNVLFAAQGSDYLAETAPSPFQHYWSLGFFLLPTRAWELGIRGLAAFALHASLITLNARASAIGTWVGLAGIGVSPVPWTRRQVFPAGPHCFQRCPLPW